MGGFEVGESALQGFIGLPCDGWSSFAVPQRGGDFFGGGGELLAGVVVERAKRLQLGFELAERGAELFESVRHGKRRFLVARSIGGPGRGLTVSEVSAHLGAVC